MSTLDPSTGLTCVTCRLVFQTSEIQRDHYKTEWHRYNMKRQMAELPPVTDEQFRTKVVSFKEQKEQEAKQAEEAASLLCEDCNKTFNTQKTYDNHVQSNKHLENVKFGRKGPRQPRKKTSTVSTETDGDEKKQETEPKEIAIENGEEIVKEEAEDVDMKEEKEIVEEEDEGEDSDSSGWHTDNGEDEDEKMEDDLDEEYDYDEKDALPITSCLFCPQSTSSMEANLDHMQRHHGFRIPDQQYLADTTGMMEYLGLKVGAGRVCINCPDTKGRYPNVNAVQQHMVDKEHCRISREPQSMLEFADWYDYSALYDELADKDGPVDDGWTLTLPSGAKIGHRLLMRYYKQNVRGIDTPRNASRLAIEKATGQHRALSWIGGGSATKNNQMVLSKSQMSRVAKDIKMMERVRRRFQLRANVWSNKLFKTGGRVGDN